MSQKGVEAHMDLDAIRPALRWRNNTLEIIDQTRLPLREEWIQIRELEEAKEAIRALRIRGAPAIGVFAAYSLVVELNRRFSGAAGGKTGEDFLNALDIISDELISTRPTAVNLANSLNRINDVMHSRSVGSATVATLHELLFQTVQEIHREDGELCRRMGQHGSELIPRGARILTHCNTGALATAGIGTALGVFFTAHQQEKNITVFADETRPLLQGARLTVWELQKAGIPSFLITDSMAAHIMKTQKIDLVMLGADRIASNGDVANKIGTFGLAILARHFGIPFYVVAPTTTLDRSLVSGDQIPIEERAPDEIRRVGGCQVAPEEISVKNFAFDVTPAELITAIVTEEGIFHPPYNFS